MQLHSEIQEILEAAKDLEANFSKLEKEMGDCRIPENIQKRKNDFNAYSQKFDRIQDELKDLKQANLTFSGSKPQAEHIKKVIKDIEGSIAK